MREMDEVRHLRADRRRRGEERIAHEDRRRRCEGRRRSDGALAKSGKIKDNEEARGKNPPFPTNNPPGKDHPQPPKGQNGNDKSFEDGPYMVNGGAATSAFPNLGECDPQGKNLV
jgi:hypothetical protein